MKCLTHKPVPLWLPLIVVRRGEQTSGTSAILFSWLEMKDHRTYIHSLKPRQIWPLFLVYRPAPSTPFVPCVFIQLRSKGESFYNTPLLYDRREKRHRSVMLSTYFRQQITTIEGKRHTLIRPHWITVHFHHIRCMPCFGYVWFSLRPCHHNDDHTDDRLQTWLNTDEQTQVHSARSALVVAHPSSNRGRCALTSVNVPLS